MARVHPSRRDSHVVARLEAEVRALVTSPALMRRWGEMGVQGVGSSAADFSRFLSHESQRWARVIKTAGIQID